MAAPDKTPELTSTEPVVIYTGRANALMEALARKSAATRRAVGMYQEALRAVARDDGPECWHVAAYELREFMNALPKALDLPILHYEQLIAKVQVFVGAWKNKALRSECLKGGLWEGEIDGPLRGMLVTTAALITWVEDQVPTRRTEAAEVLRRLAPTAETVPAALIRMRTDEWSDLLQYFNSRAHHNVDVESREFRRRVEELEIFLLEHLEPKTFDDQGEIDRLIGEAEGR